VRTFSLAILLVSSSLSLNAAFHRETAELNELKGQKDKELEATETKIKSLEDLFADLQKQKSDLEAQVLAEREAANARAQEEQETLKAQIAKVSEEVQKDLRAKLAAEEAAKNERLLANLGLLADKHELIDVRIRHTPPIPCS
jgi:chromosome segregation ATPase